ncbi:MAG: LysM peptidoglycan-binding domain-containing protein [Ferruginibacter sp.]|nr:LysM peptidoglycan-binding domain-containing protein [Ferruginibacter sp.]
MKNFLLLLFLVPLFAAAQTPHTVKAKETLYSLARKYNVHPRELAAYNNIPVETSLVLGQVIRIPLKTTMAPLSAAPPKTETVVKKEESAKPVVPEIKAAEKKEPEPQKAATVKNIPIYHRVAKKETLYAISKKYNNISIADIKKWNNLSGDGLSEGTNLVVGYKKSTETIEPAVQPEKTVAVTPKEKPVEKQTIPENRETVKTEKAEPVKKEEIIPVKTVPVKEENNNVAGKDFQGGVFKSLYNQQASSSNERSSEKGTAGVFKSMSGWEDGKYYCLSNAVPAGTIVKVTYPATGKSVYAKVLDLIPDLKQNAGIMIRLSNAATSELGVNDDIFECSINY